MSLIPVEIVNLIFSFVGSDTAPLIKSFVKKVEENYRKEFDEFDLDRDFFAGALKVGHCEKLLKNGRVFCWSSLDFYDEFEPEIFGDENRTGEKEIWEDFKEVGENYRKKGCYLLL
jgi:hypothetical protein